MAFCPFARVGVMGYLGMDEFISIKDMCDTMQMRGEDREFIPFSITFVTADLKKGTGGKKITFDDAIFVGGPSRSSEKKRNANHYANFTRNIRHRQSDRIITIHPILVLKFNGMIVTQ
jgi:hypothetical protein